ncbi:hypothetical protein TIFTF001_025128 [Ficus carica]|uniref:Uncharacterized protein n=1 Tax=Ficus carica TaxID=3494 RepID=A0AA88AI86_FICCA|nr:hypothetical protein TIFTF001_025128 [Ficus carica]
MDQGGRFYRDPQQKAAWVVSGCRDRSASVGCNSFPSTVGVDLRVAFGGGDLLAKRPWKRERNKVCIFGFVKQMDLCFQILVIGIQKGILRIVHFPNVFSSTVTQPDTGDPT